VRRIFAIVAFVSLVFSGQAAAYFDDEPRLTEPDLFWPAWLSEVSTDGTIAFRYPRGWIENETRTFGHVLSDNKSPTAAFVGVRYLPRRTWDDPAEYARVVTRTLRPPRGRGTTILRTQAANLGNCRGVEVAVMWQVRLASPLGPTMRVFGIELDSGEVALVTFAAEKPSYHNVFFAWVKESIAWRGRGS
jgi:hypothetical protein